MAKFGSGDVLTGIIAGLLSQNKNLEDGCNLWSLFTKPGCRFIT